MDISVPPSMIKDLCAVKKSSSSSSHPAKIRRRRLAELPEYDIWRCPYPGCNKAFSKLSRSAISDHRRYLHDELEFDTDGEIKPLQPLMSRELFTSLKRTPAMSNADVKVLELIIKWRQERGISMDYVGDVYGASVAAVGDINAYHHAFQSAAVTAYPIGNNNNTLNNNTAFNQSYPQMNPNAYAAQFFNSTAFLQRNTANTIFSTTPYAIINATATQQQGINNMPQKRSINETKPQDEWIGQSGGAVNGYSTAYSPYGSVALFTGYDVNVNKNSLSVMAPSNRYLNPSPSQSYADQSDCSSTESSPVLSNSSPLSPSARLPPRRNATPRLSVTTMAPSISDPIGINRKRARTEDYVKDINTNHNSNYNGTDSINHSSITGGHQSLSQGYRGSSAYMNNHNPVISPLLSSRLHPASGPAYLH